MRINKEIPLLTVYSPNKQDILCSVAQPKHAKITYNFNSCSTLQFQVDKNIFDSKTGKWIENPCYNDLAENNLLYMLLMKTNHQRKHIKVIIYHTFTVILLHL